MRGTSPKPTVRRSFDALHSSLAVARQTFDSITQVAILLSRNALPGQLVLVRTWTVAALSVSAIPLATLFGDIVFAGYHTAKPKNGLGDYRTIGRVSLHSNKVIQDAGTNTGDDSEE